MVRKSSRITPSPPAGVSKDRQLIKECVRASGTADVSPSPKSSPADQHTLPARGEISAYPSWVHNRAPDSSAKLLKSEPEKLTTSEDYLTCAEMAAILRVSLRTVRRFIAEGRIRHIRVGRQVRIPRKGVSDGF